MVISDYQRFDYDDLIEKKPTTDQLKNYIQDLNFFTLPAGEGGKSHAKKIDKILGFRSSKIEQELLKKHRAYFKSADGGRKTHLEESQTWIGLHPQVLQTPYSEILHFLQYLLPYQPTSIIDLGAGYGRVGIVMQSILPETNFIGYEIVSKRLREANRMFGKLELERCCVKQQNVLDHNFRLPHADVYFIYDFSDLLDLRKMLNLLAPRLYSKRFFIVARGEGIRSLIQLKYPQFWASHGAIHRKDWSLYSSFCDL